MLTSSLSLLLCSPTATGTAVQLGARTPPTAPRPTWASAALPTPPRGHTEHRDVPWAQEGLDPSPGTRNVSSVPAAADDTEWKNLAASSCWGKKNQHYSTLLGEPSCS